MVVGISSYGACIPRYRIESSAIARVWGQNPDGIGKQLGARVDIVATLLPYLARAAMAASEPPAAGTSTVPPPVP